MAQNDKKIEAIVDSFENAMKKGFISGLILLVLEGENCHGYKIAEKIKDLTLDVFQPTVSTLYPLLKSLREKDLIDCIEEDDSGGRLKKVYAISSKGKDTLKMIIQKHQIMTESIKSIILSTLDITDETEPSFLEDIDKLIISPEMELIKPKSKASKIETLKYHRELHEKQIEIWQKNIEMIDDIISKLEKKSDKGNIEPPSKEIASH
jgi:DNA-binding PadR family transcriptional regulator